MRTPRDVLADLCAADPGRPRVTHYDDAAGERVELSALVLSRWVAKAGNLLQDELDVGPGSVVRVDLPAHWRATYWALAVWSLGATLELPEDDGSDDNSDDDSSAGDGSAADTATIDSAGRAPEVDVLVTADVDAARSHAGDTILVSLPMLARSHPAAPAGVIDEARELSSYGDTLEPYEEPDDEQVALAGSGTTYADLVVHQPDWGIQPRVVTAGPPARLLATCLSAWDSGGSVVLVTGTDAARTDGAGAAGDEARLQAEGVTLDTRP